MGGLNTLGLQTTASALVACREHCEGKLEIVQVGAVAKKLEALGNNTAKLEQDMAAKVQELDKRKGALQDMQEQKAANDKAIKALLVEVGTIAGRLGSVPSGFGVTGQWILTAVVCGQSWCGLDAQVFCVCQVSGTALYQSLP